MKRDATLVPMPIGEKMVCAQCRRSESASTGVKPNFVRLPDAWLFSVGLVEGATLLITCCSDTCAAEWQQQNITRDDGRVLQ